MWSIKENIINNRLANYMVKWYCIVRVRAYCQNSHP